MTESDHAEWLAFDRLLARPAGSPCRDCLPAFALEMRRLRACNGQPGFSLAPSTASERLRQQWRVAARNRRERLRLAREAVA